MIHRALCIQETGLEWTYGETRPTDDEFRIAYYKHFDSESEFQAALGRLRKWLSGDDLATEIECVSAYDRTMRIDE